MTGAVGRYRIAEWSFRSAVEYANPWREVGLAFVFTTPAGLELRVPAFWAGGKRWRARYSSGELGEHRFRTECSDSRNAGLHGRIGAVRVVEAAGENRVDLHGRTGSVTITGDDSENPLFRHGPVRLDPSRTHLEHADGTPFFWLADTWWLGLAERLRWPEDVQRLTRDRVAKGFTVVQIVAGLYPDMEPFDERARSEAGFPWDRHFSRINPAYFDAADRRIMHLVESGVVPCIVGAWGFFMDFAGPGAMHEHWRYLVARWGALPVVWCLAGEAGMPFYTSEEGRAYLRLGLQERIRYRNPDRIRAWSDVARSVRSQDPFGRPFTVHPTRSGRAQVDDPSLLDFEMLQTGHLGFATLADTVDMIEGARAAEPRLPLLVGEAKLRRRVRFQPRGRAALSVLDVDAERRHGAHLRRARHLAGQPAGQALRPVTARPELRGPLLAGGERAARRAASGAGGALPGRSAVVAVRAASGVGGAAPGAA